MSEGKMCMQKNKYTGTCPDRGRERDKDKLPTKDML